MWLSWLNATVGTTDEVGGTPSTECGAHGFEPRWRPSFAIFALLPYSAYYNVYVPRPLLTRPEPVLTIPFYRIYLKVYVLRRTPSSALPSSLVFSKVIHDFKNVISVRQIMRGRALAPRFRMPFTRARTGAQALVIRRTYVGLRRGSLYTRLVGSGLCMGQLGAVQLERTGTYAQRQR